MTAIRDRVEFGAHIWAFRFVRNGDSPFGLSPAKGHFLAHDLALVI